jgi:signal peptidase
VTLLLIGATASLIGLGLLPHLGLYRPVTVLSGSMRPTFNPGDLIIVRPEPLRDVRVGQVISYSVPVGAHQVETHRVIRILHGGANPTIETQGDANNWKDPWVAQLHGTTAWRLAAVVPYAGYAINTMRNHTLHTLSIIVVPLLLAIMMLIKLWGVTPGKRKARHARA